ncbi:nickel/cobalt transporter [Paracoccus aestuariivivens]|uniref:Nickel/cobalt efflux system n=1 Tax=Paracoccus aestuariivivens TaxID=1820333 RepID=A0A6L6J8M2_9RHOB|nr:hypothetical protein [Paracoccus aestuariivivens]MTH78503.1 hypothetical protein [Paracoccus aestuariivivens]
MRRAILIVPLVLFAALLWWLAAGMDLQLARWAAGWQRDFQNQLAGILRSLRAHETGASGVLLTLCFGYGFFHALGPGHGKVIIGGYGLGRNVPLLRLSLISVLAALGQATTAILLVWLGMLTLGLTRTQLTTLAEGHLISASAVATGLVGLWLAFRGAAKLLRQRQAATHSDHHHHDDHCGCGHSHGPTPEQLRQSGSLREMLALILGIAIRPCSGAILLLVLTWHMGILTAGLLGVIAMSMGTATLTIVVAGLSVFARETTVLSAGQAGYSRQVLPLFEVLAGLGIAALSLGMIA